MKGPYSRQGTEPAESTRRRRIRAYVGACSAQEVAARLAVSEGTVRRWLTAYPEFAKRCAVAAALEHVDFMRWAADPSRSYTELKNASVERPLPWVLRYLYGPSTTAAHRIAVGLAVERVR